MNGITLQNAFARLQTPSLQLQSLGIPTPAVTPFGGFDAPPLMPVDTVTLGGPGYDAGLMPSPRQLAQNQNFQPLQAPSLSDIPDPNDPDYFEKMDRYYEDALRQLDAARALQQANPVKDKDGEAKAQKGDLNVVAGNRNDGVKAKKVTIHEKRHWSTRQWNENITEDNKYESKFENAQVGKTYQVNVEWEDGTTTTRDVEMDSPGQTVFIDNAY